MKLLAQVGKLNNPYGPSGFNVAAYNSTVPGYGLYLILKNLVNFAIIIAGLYVFFNFILAGYQFISAGGDPKNIAKASAKIWQSILGLLVAAGSFILASVIGLILYKNPWALLTFTIFTP